MVTPYFSFRGSLQSSKLARGVDEVDAQVVFKVGLGLGLGIRQFGAVAATAIQRNHGAQIGLADIVHARMGHGARAGGHEAGVIDLVLVEENQAVLQQGQPQQGDDGADHGELDHGAAALARPAE